MKTEKTSSFEDNMISTGEYLICVVYDQFGNAIEKGAGDSIGIKWLGKSFSVGPGVIISAVKHVKAGDSFRESLIDIGVDTLVGLSGPVAPFFVISKVANSASDKTEQYLLSYKDVHDLNARFGDTSEEFERRYEQGIVNFLAVLDRGVDFSKDKLNEYNIPLFGIMSLKDGTLSQLNSMAFELGLNLIENAKRLIANSPGGLYGIMSLKDSSLSKPDGVEENTNSPSGAVDTASDLLNIQWFNSKGALYSFLDTSINFNPPDTSDRQARESAIVEFNRERDLAKDALEKKRDELFSAHIRRDDNVRQLEYKKKDSLGELKNKLQEQMSEYKTNLSKKWNEHWDYLSKHRREEQVFKEKHPKDRKGYDRFCQNNRDKETKRADYITEEYGSVPGTAAVIGGSEDYPPRNFDAGRQYYKIIDEYKKQKASLIDQYNLLIDQEKTRSQGLYLALAENFKQAEAEFKATWGKEGGCYDTDDNGEYINQSEYAIAIRKKYPQELEVMGVFAECMHIEGLSQDLFFSAQESGNDTDSENRKLATSVAQLNSIYESIVEKMQIATESYQKGEIDEETYVNLSQECKTDDEQFVAIAESLEPNELLTEEFKAALRQHKNFLRLRHDSVLKDIIVKKLEKIASNVKDTDKNRDNLASTAVATT